MCKQYIFTFTCGHTMTGYLERCPYRNDPYPGRRCLGVQQVPQTMWVRCGRC